MNIHCCLLDAECRKYGAPARLHITVGRRSLGIALKPGSRFAYIDRPDRWTTWGWTGRADRAPRA